MQGKKMIPVTRTHETSCAKAPECSYSYDVTRINADVCVLVHNMNADIHCNITPESSHMYHVTRMNADVCIIVHSMNADIHCNVTPESCQAYHLMRWLR